MKHLFLLVAVIFSPPAVAADLPAVVIGTLPIEVEERIDERVSVSDSDAYLGETLFTNFIEELGVKPATESMSCLEDGTQRAWVVPSMADAEGNIFVEAFALETVSGPDQRCFQREALQASINSKLPGLEATRDVVAKLFPGDLADGMYSYAHTTMLGDEGYNWLMTTTLTYELRNGAVQSLALSRRNSPTPAGLSRFKYWSPTIIAEQIDVRTFPSSLGPRIEDEKRTLSDYGFSDSYRRGSTSEFFDDNHNWMIAFRVLEATDEHLVLCITDAAQNGGTYRTEKQVAFREGEDGLLVATDEVPGLPGCD